MTEKLKACPFCGGEARYGTERYYRHDKDIGVNHRCFCGKCFALVNSVYNKESSVEAWNTRTSEAVEVMDAVGDAALTAAIAIGEYALTAKYTGMLTEDTIITRDVLKTLITHALKGESK